MSMYPPAAHSYASLPGTAVSRQMPEYTEPGYEKRATNVMAFFSILAAASAWLLTGPLGSIAGLVLGLMALSQLKKREEDGKELAVIAIIFSAVSMVMGTVLLVGIINFVQSLPTI